MQAQLTRLDALGERLSTLAGIPQDFRFNEAPGLGGAAPTLMPPQNLSLADFSEKLTLLSRQVENRNDMLGVLEAQLFEQAVKKKLMPTMMPVSAPYNASGFGRRIDPFTGQRAMHEGIDFLADIGTPVVAAAGGVVVFAGFHPQYGYMVDIDHGNDLVTRYAHNSKLLVTRGRRGAARAARSPQSGSTGRSTGPHLHFEVRFRGRGAEPQRSSSCRTRSRPPHGPSNTPLFPDKITGFFRGLDGLCRPPRPCSLRHCPSFARPWKRSSASPRGCSAAATSGCSSSTPHAVESINALEAGLAALSDEALRAKTEELRKRHAEGATLDELLPDAFAVVREAAKRTLAHAPLRRAAHRRHGAAQRQDRGDADRRGQDAGRDAARLPQCARRARACTSSR